MSAIPYQAEWTDELIRTGYDYIAEVAKDFKLDTYPNQIEIITSKQMLEAYATVGMPSYYSHWSFGKSFLASERNYEYGHSGLAYEIVINSDPCIAYLMEENSLTMQLLVMSHACVAGETEFLSPNGWKRIDQYDGDLVAQYNADGTSTFVKPSGYVKRPQKDFIHVRGTSVEQKITPDHRVIFVNGNNNLVEITGEALKRRHEQKTKGFNGRFITGFKLSTEGSLDLSDDHIRLHIAIKADGSVMANKHSGHFNCAAYDKVRFHLKKKRKISRLISILDRLGIDFDMRPTYEGRYSIKFKYPAIPKKYTEDWYSASAGQREIIAEECLYWDGCVRSQNFSSANKQDVDYIQFIWASIGLHTRVSYGTRTWLVQFSAKPLKGIGHDRGNTPWPDAPSTDGFAYCFTVPSGMFVTRLNNKISVTGNCFGHNSFFKNNYLFKQWTDASAIIDYLTFAKDYIRKCEEKYGAEEVELILDACHALQNYGVDRYRHPKKLSKEKQKEKIIEKNNYEQAQVNVLWGSIPKPEAKTEDPAWLDEPEENILYFLEKNSPVLKDWQREILRIVRKISTYFYPQRQTQVSNEGFASWQHYTILTEMYDRDIIGDGHMIEFLKSHSGVVYQHPYSKINPYALGFNMYRDIRRMCEHPTKEDEKWFPQLVGKNWLEEIDAAMRNYKDESFISQYLSPKVIRDMHLFSLIDDNGMKDMKVSHIHDEDGYREIRNKLSGNYNLMCMEPDIKIVGADMLGNRSLTLQYLGVRGRRLEEESLKKVLMYVRKLWGFQVRLFHKTSNAVDIFVA